MTMMTHMKRYFRLLSAVPPLALVVLWIVCLIALECEQVDADQSHLRRSNRTGSVQFRQLREKVALSEIVAQTFFLRNYEAYLVASGCLDDIGGSGPYALLTPYDPAFESSDPGLVGKLQNPKWKAHLKDFVQCHIYYGDLSLDQLPQEQTITMASGDRFVQKRTMGTSRVWFNESMALATYDASNGFAYMLGDIFFPSWYYRSLLDLATQVPSLTTFTSLVVQAGLDTVLQDTSVSLTIFAPSDLAFAKLDEDATLLLESEEGQELLEATLQYHILIEGPHASIFFPTFVGPLQTLQGDLVELSAGEPMILKGKINQAAIVLMDQCAHNGILHVTDTVLALETQTPPSTTTSTTTTPATTTTAAPPIDLPFPILDGNYHIKQQGSNRGLDAYLESDIDENGSVDDTYVVTHPPEWTGSSQEWQFVPVGTMYYVQHVNTGKYLSAPYIDCGWCTARLTLYDSLPNRNFNALWVLRSRRNFAGESGGYLFQNVRSRRYLYRQRVAAATSAAGYISQQRIRTKRTLNNPDANKWFIHLSPDGHTQLEAADAFRNIDRKRDNELIARNYMNANEFAEGSQRWALLPVGMLYEIRHVESGRYLDSYTPTSFTDEVVTRPKNDQENNVQDWLAFYNTTTLTFSLRPLNFRWTNREYLRGCTNDDCGDHGVLLSTDDQEGIHWFITKA